MTAAIVVKSGFEKLRAVASASGIYYGNKDAKLSDVGKSKSEEMKPEDISSHSASAETDENWQ